MPSLDLRQVCWNHEEREAVCRCPQCARSFCRECVTEHEGRLLCAACLRAISAPPPQGLTGLRRVRPAAMFIAGVLLAWLIFFGMGKSLLQLMRRLEQPSASSRVGDTVSHDRSFYV